MNSSFFFGIGIVTDVKLTRSIEAIEDALGNEIYYFFTKTERKKIEHKSDFDEERMLISFIIFKIKLYLFYFRHSPQEILLNKIKRLENQVRTIRNHVINILF
jgi:hypothetical protein